MRIHGESWRSIFLADDGWTVTVIDQTRLPFALEVCHLRTAEDAAQAIREMVVRGAPLIGVTAAYGVALGLRADATDEGLRSALKLLGGTRPTAVNLCWALARMMTVLGDEPPGHRVERAYAEARRIAEEDVAACAAIGRHGATILEQLSSVSERRPVNVLTHCNAGWLACVEHGTATAPIYAAAAAGVELHVWVDETRPLNQGARLTAWELARGGIPHTVVADNTGGHLMQHGMVDLVIVGADRVTAAGDAANKIGTYLKALAARDTQVPFYVALPSSTFDWSVTDGLRQIPIEERDPDEVRFVDGWDGEAARRVRITPAESPAANYAFDVTPARLITGLITERGVCRADTDDIRRLFPRG